MLGAAVADDVLGLVILTVVVKVVVDGNIGVGTIAGTVGLAVGFLLFTGIVGLALVPSGVAVRPAPGQFRKRRRRLSRS